MLKYNYALDNQGNVISIVDVPEEGHLEKEFFCIGCGGPMVAAIGPKRRYFRHKADETNCNKESYLHKLAKFRIKQRFDDRSKPFEIKLFGTKECVRNCKMFEEKTCTSQGLHKPIDLHNFYDTCEIEKGIEGFVADLLLSHSKHPNRAPILIEVYVKHRCTEEKINSGHKIIEVSVDSEESIERLLVSPWIDSEIFSSYYRKRTMPLQTFYGFNPPPQKTEHSEGSKCEIILDNFPGKWVKRFILFPSMKYIFKEISCFEKDKPFPQNSLLQININRDLWKGVYPLEIAHYLKRKYGIELKACSLCRYFWVDRYDARHCNKNEDETIAGVMYDKLPEFKALTCPKYELKWLNTLYKHLHLSEDHYLKEEEIEIIVPYNKQ